MQLLQTENESKTCPINTTSPKQIKQLYELADNFLTDIGQLRACRCRPKGVCFQVPRQSGHGKHDLNKELLFILPHPEHTR